MTIFIKDPQENLAFSIDWAALGYLAAGVTISSSAWSFSPDDSADSDGLALATESSTGTATEVSISGGKNGFIYRVANSVTLSDGQTAERSLVIRVEDQ